VATANTSIPAGPAGPPPRVIADMIKQGQKKEGRGGHTYAIGDRQSHRLGEREKEEDEPPAARNAWSAWLWRRGVTHVFACGRELFALLRTLRRERPHRPSFTCRHEGGAANMAVGPRQA